MCTIDGMTFHAPPCICTAAWTYLAKKFGADQATQYNLELIKLHSTIFVSVFPHGK